MSFNDWIKALGVTVAVTGMFAVQPLQPVRAQDSTQQTPTQPALLSAEELETMVARIALYPDDLVALVLAGSLYPLQIVQADRYLSDVKAKPGLKPNADWDGSVISLLNYPQIIKMMNDDLNWTQQMGQAVAAWCADPLALVGALLTKSANPLFAHVRPCLLRQTRLDTVPYGRPS